MSGWSKFKTGVKKVAHQLTDEMNDESQIHREIQALVDNLSGILHLQSKVLAPQVSKAADDLLGELNNLLKADTRCDQSKLPVIQYQLAKDTLNSIYKYKPRLEAEPGLWNQFKAHINNFFEWYFGYPDLLSLQTSPFGSKTQRFFVNRPLVSLTTEFKLKFDEELLPAVDTEDARLLHFEL